MKEIEKSLAFAQDRTEEVCGLSCEDINDLFLNFQNRLNFLENKVENLETEVNDLEAENLKMTKNIENLEVNYKLYKTED